jgi:hypothetical protein
MILCWVLKTMAYRMELVAAEENDPNWVAAEENDHKLVKGEVVDFLLAVMRGRTPIYDVGQLNPDQVDYDFVTGLMMPKLVVPKMSDRIKACEGLVKIYGLNVVETKIIETRAERKTIEIMIANSDDVKH